MGLGNEGQSQHLCGIQSELKASLSNLYESLCPSGNHLEWPEMSRGGIHIKLFSIKERESTETTIRRAKLLIQSVGNKDLNQHNGNSWS